METCTLKKGFFLFLQLLLFLFLINPCGSYLLHPLVAQSRKEHQNYTDVSEFRVVNRRALLDCPNVSPNISIVVNQNTLTGGGLSNDQYVSVTVDGVILPFADHWVAMISPSNADASTCLLNEFLYAQTGDLTKLPLLCHYPVKAQMMKKDPEYMDCKKRHCQNPDGKCKIGICGGTISFHVINIRTDIEFVFFGGGLLSPCILARSGPVKFNNVNSPLYGHLSSVDSTGQSMRLTWVTGDSNPEQVQYGNGMSVTSTVSTFTQQDMCSSEIPSPAKDFGWHDPGFIHTAVMTGLAPSTKFAYRYGSNLVGWSNQIEFKTPPAAGADELRFVTFGDMGKAPFDASVEHYIQPGSQSVIKAIASEVDNGAIDSVFHIGDISYATGFLVEWDFFLHQINPVASRIPYMTGIGNHERNYNEKGTIYKTPDSGGECGVPYETYFPMPTPAKDKPWYSIEQGPIHFTIMSTEHSWSPNSEQFEWIKIDLASVNRVKTPWLIFAGHRPMYTSVKGLLTVDDKFKEAVEPLLLANKVDVSLFGHVHNYERSCSLFQDKCLGTPVKDGAGVDVYDHTSYSAPLQLIIGMAGFSLDKFPKETKSWSLVRLSEFGYLRAQATKQELTFEMVNSDTRQVRDKFRVVKRA